MRTAFAALAAMAILGIARTQAPYDVVIRNGRVLDGTGASWFRADIAIKGDTIVRIARTITEPATQVIDAAGAIVPVGAAILATAGVQPRNSLRLAVRRA